MSKRFGRNQKRKMREALSEKDKKLQKLEEDIRYTKQTTAMEKDCLRMTEQILGKYFPTVIPTTQEISHHPFSVASYNSLMDIYEFDMNNRILDLSFTLQQLYCIEYQAEVDKLRNILYLKVNTPFGGSVAYNYDFRKIPAEVIEILLIRDLVPHLVHEIKRGINGK